MTIRFSLIIVLLLLQISATAQYRESDRELGRTVFQREFKLDIVLPYLVSESREKQNAGLLAVAQSQNQAFVPILLQNADKYDPVYLTFALGQIGESPASAEYLLKMWQKSHQSSVGKNYLAAFGRTGDKSDLQSFIEFLQRNEIIDLAGIGECYLEFYSRGIISSDLKTLLLKKLETLKPKDDLFLEIVYALRRSGESESIYSAVDQIIREYDTLNPEQLKRFTSYFRMKKGRTDYPITFDKISEYLFSKVQSYPDLGMKGGTHSGSGAVNRLNYALAAAYYPFQSMPQVLTYLSLLKDSVRMVALRCAESISIITLPDSLRSELQSFLLQVPSSDFYAEDVKKRVAISTLKLFPELSAKVYDQLRDQVSMLTMLSIGEAVPESTVGQIENWLSKYPELSIPEQCKFITIISSAKSVKYDSLMLQALHSNNPFLSATTLEVIDSAFIFRNASSLLDISRMQLCNHLHEPDFADAVRGYYKVVSMIDAVTGKELLEHLLSSEVYSVHRFAAQQSSKDVQPKSDNYFDLLWNSAFRYWNGVVTTTNGEFGIAFLPQYAPVSVGNFVYNSLIGTITRTRFHRVVPGFVIQTGDPSGTGSGGPGYEIVSEFSPLHFGKGMVGMASSGKDTEGSQWFVMTGDYPHLNGRYTVWGVGMMEDKTELIDEGDSIRKIVFH